MPFRHPAPSSIATAVRAGSVALILTSTIATPARAGELQEQAGRWAEKLFQRQGGKLLSGYGPKIVVFVLADRLGVSHEVAGNLFKLVKLASAGASTDLARLSPLERAALDRGGAAYARNCPPYDDISTALKLVPIPDPPTPDAEIACAALHDMGIIALKLAR